MPLVSVCVPTFNGYQYIAEALQSIEHQTYQNIEIIVSDDASTDGTLEILETFKNQADIPVHIFHHLPNGIGANWNNCLKHASGKYIKFLFQDDVMLPGCLEEMISVFEQYPKVAMVASKRDFIIETRMKTDQINQWVATYGDLQAHMHLPPQDIHILDKAIFGLPTFYASPLNKVGEPSVVMFKKDIISKVGYFDKNLKQILDYEYWYRILKKHPVAIINKPLVKFRLHQNQATNVNRNQNIDDYQYYEQILYKDYYSLLHPKVKKRLYLKFHPFAKFKKRVIGKLKRMLQ